jgi:predicted nuclease of predicted toxin-antitoxin system
MKNKIDPLIWIKENARLFLDQNIPIKIFKMLKEQGYKNISNVYLINYIGVNDGKLLKLIQEQKFILITFDKKFHKMAVKYNKGASILVKRETTDGRVSEFISDLTIKKRIQNTLIHNFKQIKSFFEDDK